MHFVVLQYFSLSNLYFEKLSVFALFAKVLFIYIFGDWLKTNSGKSALITSIILLFLRDKEGKWLTTILFLLLILYFCIALGSFVLFPFVDSIIIRNLLQYVTFTINN